MADKDRVELRDAILDAATHVFVTDGFHSATLDAVATAAGTAVETVRRWYPTRDDVLIAVLSRRDDRGADVTRLLGQVSGLDLLHRVKDMVAGWGDERDAVTLFASSIGGALVPGHPAREWAQERYRWGLALYAAAFRRDIDAGLIRPDVDPTGLARHLLAMLDGLQIQWLLEDEPFDPAATVGADIDRLIDSVRVATP